MVRPNGMVAWPSRERLKRVHALCGVVPLAAFVTLHLWGNAYVVWGRDRFESHLRWVEGLPARPLWEVVGILLPLLVHVAIGIRLMMEPGPEPVAARPAGRDWGLILQRGSGLLALVFVAVHLGHYRWPRATGDLAMTELFDRSSADLQGMARFAFYLAGTSAVVFHLAQGLTRFFLPPEHRMTTAARRRVIVLCSAFGLGLWLLSLEVLGQYYSGGSVSGSLGILRRLAGGTP